MLAIVFDLLQVLSKCCLFLPLMNYLYVSGVKNMKGGPQKNKMHL